MFRKAYSVSAQYTLPVVLSRKTIAGDCSSAIGAFVVINKEGWIVTANHIIDQLNKLIEGEKTALGLEAQRKAIESDTSIDAKERRHRLQKIRKLGREDTHRASAWWGGLPNNTRLVYSVGIEPVDIAIGKLEPFDPAWINTYPVFKDPSKEFEPGTSLCKLGFPFHSIRPLWNEAAQTFELPKGTIPLPRFPIDGIFTRTVIIQIPDVTFSFPLQWVETSTPGLKGQSGGPIFDVNGTIWAIQCQTRHLPLGFDPPVPGGRMGEKEHQFLNLGVGAHPETLFGLFRQEKISFQISDY
jgi:hypothetical protein